MSKRLKSFIAGMDVDWTDSEILTVAFDECRKISNHESKISHLATELASEELEALSECARRFSEANPGIEGFSLMHVTPERPAYEHQAPGVPMEFVDMLGNYKT